MGRSDFGIMAKIETPNAIHNLSKILLSGLDLPEFGIFIARGIWLWKSVLKICH